MKEPIKRYPSHRRLKRILTEQVEISPNQLKQMVSDNGAEVVKVIERDETVDLYLQRSSIGKKFYRFKKKFPFLVIT